MAYCSGYSFIHTLDCSDCSGSDYYAILGPDFDSDNCFPHTVLAAVIDFDLTSTHTGPALMLGFLIDIMCYCVDLHIIHITPMDWSVWHLLFLAAYLTV